MDWLPSQEARIEGESLIPDDSSSPHLWMTRVEQDVAFHLDDCRRHVQSLKDVCGELIRELDGEKLQIGRSQQRINMDQQLKRRERCGAGGVNTTSAEKGRPPRKASRSSAVLEAGPIEAEPGEAVAGAIWLTSRP
jgi:hypothetical protein